MNTETKKPQNKSITLWLYLLYLVRLVVRVPVSAGRPRSVGCAVVLRRLRLARVQAVALRVRALRIPQPRQDPQQEKQSRPGHSFWLLVFFPTQEKRL